MPHLRHCPTAKHQKDRNPMYYDEKQKDGAKILAVYPPKNVEREQK
jgi:hypothetical protein